VCLDRIFEFSWTLHHWVLFVNVDAGFLFYEMVINIPVGQSLLFAWNVYSLTNRSKSFYDKKKVLSDMNMKKPARNMLRPKEAYIAETHVYGKPNVKEEFDVKHGT
jgi:hypothetical protein